MPELVVACRGLTPHDEPLARALGDQRGIVVHREGPADVVWLGAGAAPEAAKLTLVSPPADARRIRAVGGTLAVVHRRDSPPFRRAAELVGEGRLGVPRSVVLHLVEPGRPDPAGALFEAVDIVRAVVGLEVVAVRAAGGANPVVLAELERGVAVTIVVGGGPEDGSGLRRIVLVGSQAMLAVEEDRPRLERRGTAHPAAGGAIAARAAALAAELRGIVQHGRPPACGAEPALRAAGVVEAIERARSERRRVVL